MTASGMSMRHRVSSQALYQSIFIAPYVFEKDFFQADRVALEGCAGQRFDLADDGVEVSAGEDGEGAAFAAHVVDAFGPANSGGEIGIEDDLETLIAGFQIVEDAGYDGAAFIEDADAIGDLFDFA